MSKKESSETDTVVILEQGDTALIVKANGQIIMPVTKPSDGEDSIAALTLVAIAMKLNDEEWCQRIMDDVVGDMFN